MAGLLAEKADLRAGERGCRDGAALESAATRWRAAAGLKSASCGAARACFGPAPPANLGWAAGERRAGCGRHIVHPRLGEEEEDQEGRREQDGSPRPHLQPDTGSHRVALGGEWALGQNRPARRKGHPRPTLYSAFPRTLNRAVLRAGELVLKCAAGGVARCRTWAACRCLYHSARTILCRQTVGTLCAFVCVIHAVHVCAGECLWSVRRVSLFMRCPCQFLSLFFRGLRSPEYVNIFNKVCMIALECARGPGVLTTSREESLEQLR